MLLGNELYDCTSLERNIARVKKHSAGKWMIVLLENDQRIGGMNSENGNIDFGELAQVLRTVIIRFSHYGAEGEICFV